ncbi:MAG TPA: DUF6600 domain-containing protein, partial [Candidatus Lustribacter sp.]
PAANPSIQTQPAIARDNFDNYNDERDHIYLAATSSSQYVNTDIQGIGDLATNGNWVDDGTYGHVWIPSTVAAGWAPYRDGNWVWEDRFGWTWVAAEPWGWAPYHYGRWYFSTAYRHWAWYPPAPGRFAPAWSPALVGFVGFNIGAVRVGIGFGNIGWVPLAPFETFHPWWGPHATIVNNTTIVNNNVHYRNLMVNNAMTSVTRENFQGGHFRNRVAVSQEQLRGIHTVPMRGTLPIVPSQANLRFTQRAAAPSLAVRPALMNRTFAGRPAIAQRTPFVEQQASVSRANHGAFRPAATKAPAYVRPVDTNRATSNEPWSRFNANRNARVTNGIPAYTRPAAPNHAQPPYERSAAPAYNRPTAPTYNRPEPPANNRRETPTYNRQAAPAISRPAAPAYNRPTARTYNRPETPTYNRREAPTYNRQAAPAPVYRQAAPAYSRPAASNDRRPETTTARPAARVSHGNGEHHDR